MAVFHGLLVKTCLLLLWMCLVMGGEEKEEEEEEEENSPGRCFWPNKRFFAGFAVGVQGDLQNKSTNP